MTKINLFTNEIINKGNYNEQLVLSIPHIEDKCLLIQQSFAGCMILKSDGTPLSDVSRHGMLSYSTELSINSVEYILRASVYTLFSHCSENINNILKNQKDLTNFDKEILDAHISRYIRNYSFSTRESDYFIRDKVLYDGKLCRVEVKNTHLMVTINKKQKLLIDDLLYFIDPEYLVMDKYILELIIRYEMYLEYGLHVPETVFGAMIVDSPGVLTYLRGNYAGYIDQTSNLKSRLLYAINNNTIDTNKEDIKDSYEIGNMVKALYYNYPEDMIDLYMTYWVCNKDKFLITYLKVIEDYNKQDILYTKENNRYNTYEKQLLNINTMSEF